MARPGHPLGRTRLDLPRWSSPPRDHPVAQPRALETCPRDRPEVRLLVRRGSGVLVGEALESVVCGVLTKMVGGVGDGEADLAVACGDRKSTRLNSSHVAISYAVFCLKKKR